MKKILLIEDRVERQNLFVEKTKINLLKYCDVLDNFINNEYIEFELQIYNNNFNFSKYDYILSHKSAFGSNNSEALGRLRDYSRKNEKTLVLFSGGISSNYYNNSDFEILELNSKTFYSENLKLFLEATRNNNENVLMLCYGGYWQENIVSNVTEKVNNVLQRLDSQKIDKVDFNTFIDIEKLESIDFDFYQIKEENNQVDRECIAKFQKSLYSYFEHNETLAESKQTTFLIDNDNTEDELFDDHIKFTPNVSDIDEYISKGIITELAKQEFDVLYIKDNLSSNYLELYGLRVAYHIRLSDIKSFENKKYCPIVILSDFSSDKLNKFDQMANVLFTKNIFLIKNTKVDIEKTKKLNFSNLTLEEYQEDFLDKVKVEQPKDYLTHHSIANEWSMYRWAEYLDVNTPDIQKIRNDISSMLYFKYLQAKFPIKRSLFTKHKQEIQGEGKILYIDDEWEKGWKSIFEHLSQENKNYSLETVEEVYKDKTQEEVITFVMAKVASVNPDVIILDMRLHEDDFLENISLADLTGIQIFNTIKEINPGIQVIVFTASSNSLLLDELSNYDSSILGYVKKEHPKNYNLTTQGNINKLISLANKGLSEKYLKDIYIIQNSILEILKNDIFSKYIKNTNKYEKYWSQLEQDTTQIFDILNSNTSNKYPYAMLSIARSLEAVLSIFITERQIDNIYWDAEDCRAKKFEDKITGLMKKFGYEIENLSSFVLRRNSYIHSNKTYTKVSKTEIEQWFKILLSMIETIDNPPNYTPYIPKKEKPLAERELITTKSGIKKKV